MNPTILGKQEHAEAPCSAMRHAVALAHTLLIAICTVSLRGVSGEALSDT